MKEMTIDTLFLLYLHGEADDVMKAEVRRLLEEDPKRIGTESGWGDLPPRQRQEALQQIGKDLPAHYREVVEEYFRKLAREGGGGA